MNVEQDKLQSEGYMAQFQHELTLAHFGMKTLTIINAGAIVAILTFFGDIADTPRAGLFISNMGRPLEHFLNGLTASLITILLSYFSQILYNDFYRERGWRIQLGHASKVLAILAALLSLYFFYVGLCSVHAALLASVK